MILKSFQKLIIVGLFFSSVLARADSTQASGSSQAIDSSKELKQFGADVVFTTSSSLHSPSDPDSKASGSVILAPSFKISEEVGLSAKTEFSHDFKGLNENSVSDTEVAIRRTPWNFIEDSVGFSPGASWVLPTSDQSRNHDSLYGSLRLSPRIAFSFVSYGIPLEGKYTLSYIRNFYEFETSSTGSSNISWGLRHRLTPSIPLSEKFAINLDFIRTTGFTYKGNPKNTFDTSEEISFQAAKEIALAVGVSNGGDAYKINGVDPNLSLFDSQSGSVYGSMTVTF